jgi:hypothetical protein
MSTEIQTNANLQYVYTQLQTGHITSQEIDEIKTKVELDTILEPLVKSAILDFLDSIDAQEINVGVLDQTSVDKLGRMMDTASVALSSIVADTVADRGTATRHSGKLLMRLANVMASIVATQNEFRAILQASSLQDAQAALSKGIQAADMDIEAAAKTREATILQAEAEKVAGMVQIGMGVASAALSVAGGAVSTMNKPLIGGALMGVGQGLTAISHGVSSIITAEGKLDAAPLTYEASILQAEAKKLQAYQQMDQTMAQRADGSTTELSRSIQSMLQALQKIADTIHGGVQGIASNLSR